MAVWTAERRQDRPDASYDMICALHASGEIGLDVFHTICMFLLLRREWYLGILSEAGRFSLSFP